ncbi:hypothetical protein OHD16_27185 [Sphingobacterium sp. ML3W]|uniref:hypothetical protein n=1 Tax=Sphingobacterium sp. ML3W TaxID=1538644 RepID=UPI0030096D0A
MDLSYNSLDLASVRDLDLSVGVEDLYELSPLQQGLYYHWLSSGGSGGLYFEQLRCSIEGRSTVQFFPGVTRILWSAMGAFDLFHGCLWGPYPAGCCT